MCAPDVPGPTRFRRFWTAAAISSFGTALTTVALPVLVVQLLAASAVEVGMVNAAQWLPYAVLGLVAGAYTDRWQRRSVLVWAAIGRVVVLGCVAGLWFAGVLSVWVLVGALLAFGAGSVFGFAASQSLVPHLVPKAGLVRANSRLDQTDAAAQTLGPAIGGALVGTIGAPLALVVDAISYLAEALLVSTLTPDDRAPASAGPGLGAQIRDGLRWTYRDRLLGPLAISTHLWFLAQGVAMTALSLLALRSLGFGAWLFGALMATFGIASLVGAALAPTLGERLGTCRAVLVSRAGYPLGWAVIVGMAAGAPSLAGPALFAGMALVGLSLGTENPNEMGLWQSLTPDPLLGRVNATRRSANRTMAAVGAIGSGFLIAQVGDLGAVGVATTGFAVAFVVLVLLWRDASPTG